jgi:hypothetical protein
MSAHAPSVPPVFASLHASQALSHAVAQHTPSMQWLFRQSLLSEQACPSRRRHAPRPLQVRPTPHSRSGSVPSGMSVQIPSVAPLLAATQASHAPPQPALQQTLSMQLPLRHWFAAEQAVPSPSLAVQSVPLQ